jgi:ATP-binding cassette, subfamily B, heavy metal transporter
MMVAFAQLRDALFAKVGQSAVRHLAVKTFRHLHSLPLRFHLERRTGGLSRIIERGTKGIDTILRYSLFNSFPTISSSSPSCAASCGWNFGWAVCRGGGRRGAALRVVHLCRHRMAHQHPPRHERGRHRRQHQGHRQPAQLRDGEVFRQRGARGAPLRGSIARYEHAAVKTWTSLALLNAGQAFIFTIGLTIVMVMAAYGVSAGRDGRRLRAGQRAAHPALHAAQLSSARSIATSSRG